MGNIIKTTEWGILFNQNLRRNQQGRKPESKGYTCILYNKLIEYQIAKNKNIKKLVYFPWYVIHFTKSTTCSKAQLITSNQSGLFLLIKNRDQWESMSQIEICKR